MNIFTYKHLTVLSLFLITTACGLDHVTEIYEPTSDEPSMVQANYNDNEIEATCEEVRIPLGRSKSDADLSVDLEVSLPEGISIKGGSTVKGPEDNGNTLYTTSVTFTKGSTTADLILDIKSLEIGSLYNGYAKLSNESQYNKNTAITTCTFNLAKAYTWVSLGKGEFFCNFVSNYNEVEVLKAEGFERYRIMNPYPADVLTGPGLEYPQSGEFGICGAACPYIEFYALEDGVHIAWDRKFSTTLDYSGNGDTIWQYYPADFNAEYAPLADNCKFINDEKTLVQFWAIAYIEGLGGFGDTYAPCLLSLPGGPGLGSILE